MYDYVMAQLQMSKGSWRKISRETGLGYEWLSKVAQGAIKNPGVKQIEMLDHYFRSRKAA